jgi:hypothetical protein
MPWALFERWVVGMEPAISTVDRWRGVFLKLQEDFPAHTAATLTAEEVREWLRGLITPERSAIAAIITSANAHGLRQHHVCHQHGAYGFHCHP